MPKSFNRTEGLNDSTTTRPQKRKKSQSTNSKHKQVVIIAYNANRIYIFKEYIFYINPSKINQIRNRTNQNYKRKIDERISRNAHIHTHCFFEFLKRIFYDFGEKIIATLQTSQWDY